MKKLFLLFATCSFASIVFGQSFVIFDGEDGNNPWWNVGGATVEVVNWLQKDAVNSSNYGATIWRVDGNDSWAGGGITLDLDISSYNHISVDVLKKVEGNVQIELQDGDAHAYLNLPYTPTGLWQTLTFNIPSGWTHLTALLIAPHNVNTTENPLPTDDDENPRMSWDNVIAQYNNNTATVITSNNDDSKIVSTQIYTLTGGNIGKNIDVKSLPKGIYVVKSIDEQGNTYTKKVSVR